MTKPVDHAALVSRVRSMLRIKELHDSVLEQSAQLKFQLETATKIQSLFWPKMPELKGGSHIWGISVPAAYVGGDFFDVIPLSDGSVLAYVADVSDKGDPAALIMAALSTKIRSEALLESEVEKLIESINNSTYRLMSEEGFFITIVLARYWPDSGKMQIVVGGHFPPLWIDESGIRKMPAPSGISLGVMPVFFDLVFGMRDDILHNRLGDRHLPPIVGAVELERQAARRIVGIRLDQDVIRRVV